MAQNLSGVDFFLETPFAHHGLHGEKPQYGSRAYYWVGADHVTLIHSCIHG